MRLQAGARLGPYEILAHLGAGGMGEVYRARDTRLHRDVAVKVLPPHVLDDPALRARFEREARAASSLDHPHICPLYDVGREGGVEYLVMPLLEGETVADRVARGPLPIADALRHGAEIAAALDKAHRAGILHRDIKPGNVMLVKAGRDTVAKLLDFGLAKATADGAVSAAVSSPATATSPLTGRGTIVGTLQYMSPEQLEGRELDPRSDIFSFGAVLYEMVTGRRAFDGGSQASIIGAILEREPPPINTTAPLAPAALDRAVRKCLAKDRDRRWQSAADLCDELSWIAQSSSAAATAVGGAAPRWSRTIAIATAVLAIALVAATIALAWPMLRRTTDPSPRIARDLAIALPAGTRVARGGVAISPDGRTIVFAASTAPAETVTGGASSAPSTIVSRLYLRQFDEPAARPIEGTGGARAPFFSSDGSWIGFFTSSALMKVPIRGGPPVRVAGMPPVTRGGAWMPDDSIIVAPTQTSGLVRITADGVSHPLTQVDTGAGEQAHLWPQVLPGNEDVLFTIRRGTTSDLEASDIGIVHVATGARRIVQRSAAFARYSPTGHLLFVHGGTLSAVPFDLAAKTTRGTPIPIAEGVAFDPMVGGGHYAVAPDGALVVMRGSFPVERTTAVWVDRRGAAVPAPGFVGRAPEQPRISPDGRRMLFGSPSPEGDDEIYVMDVARATSVRLSGNPQDDFSPAWSHDGHDVIWTTMPAGGLPRLAARAADGTGPIRVLVPDAAKAQFPGSISRDGMIAFTAATAGGVASIWLVPLQGGTPRALLTMSGHEYGPEFSPDGQWIAFTATEGGVPDVYVAPYPGPGAPRRLTSGGAMSPAWSRDGHELFYQSKDGLIAVAVRTGADITFGAPRVLFGPSFVVDSREDGPRAYDVSPDGTRFIMLRSEATQAPPPTLHVLLDWAAALKK